MGGGARHVRASVKKSTARRKGLKSAQEPRSGGGGGGFRFLSFLMFKLSGDPSFAVLYILFFHSQAHKLLQTLPGGGIMQPLSPETSSCQFWDMLTNYSQFGIWCQFVLRRPKFDIYPDEFVYCVSLISIYRMKGNWPVANIYMILHSMRGIFHFINRYSNILGWDI